MGTGIEELWKTKTTPKTKKRIGVDDVHCDTDHKGPTPGSPCQVILYNDNHNAAMYVVECLMKIFGHSKGMAEKLMMEAHKSGRTIAQVEDYEKAMEHSKQLTEAGLEASVESI